jgi:hypothetical protein
MVNVLGDLSEAPRWRRAVEGDPDWEGILGGFEATVDWPGSYFYKELIAAYPDAKVLLSVRDGESWAHSMRETIWGLFYGDILIRELSNARAKVDPDWAGYLDMMREMWRRSGLMPGGPETTPEAMAEAMERFQDEVQQTVPSERLLVWSVTDGWEALCEFLDVDVPDMPFPHLNDSKEFNERVIDGSLQVLSEWRAKQESVPATR